MIPLFKPHIDAATIAAATEALELGWLGMGSFVKEFEDRLARFLELPPDRALVAVNTCTSAIHLSLRAASVGPGDEVLTPALNNAGDFQAIELCGASPVFVDVREEDLMLDPESVERMMGPRVRALIALDYAGFPCDLSPIREITAARGIALIEDAAHAIGTRRAGRMIGADADWTCFSFDAIKTLTCIDGGAIVAPPGDMGEELRAARLLGMTQSSDVLYSNRRAGSYDIPAPGYRYHLANLHGAIGLSQLDLLPTFIANRRSYAESYSRLLGDVAGIVTPLPSTRDVSLFAYVIRVLGGQREALRAHLAEIGIETGVHWLPGNRFTRWRSVRGAEGLRVTDRIGDEIMTLPLWSFMDEDTVERVASGVSSFFGSLVS